MFLLEYKLEVSRSKNFFYQFTYSEAIMEVFEVIQNDDLFKVQLAWMNSKLQIKRNIQAVRKCLLNVKWFFDLIIVILKVLLEVYCFFYIMT